MCLVGSKCVCVVDARVKRLLCAVSFNGSGQVWSKRSVQSEAAS